MKKIRTLIGKLLYTISFYTVLPTYVDGSRRSRVIILCGDEVLLGKTIISSQHWQFPGGGKEEDETIEECAIREVHEELGIKLEPEQLNKFGEDIYKVRWAKYTEVYLKAEFKQKPALSPRKLEILDAKWFSLSNLPKGTHPAVEKSLKRMGISAA